jgi:hypothetical protein
MTTPKKLDDVLPPRYEPQTPEERAGLERAIAVRDYNRSIRRTVGQIIAKIDGMEEREKLRRRFVRR